MMLGPYTAQVLGLPYAISHGPRLKKITQCLEDKKGAVIACEDAVGIAQELSLHHLTAAIPYIEWLKSIDSEDTFNKGVTNQ